MTARAPALFCSVLSLQAGRGARVRAGVMRLNACSVPLSRRETTNGSPQGMGRGSHLRSRVLCVNDHVCAGSVPLSRRERGRGEGAHLRSRVLCVNDRSCLGLGEAPLFRAAAAARATFLAGKVAKAIHAAACAVLRTVPCAARRVPCPLSHPASRPSPARAFRARARSACAAPGANSPIHGLEHARLSLAPGCAARRWPTLPRSKATARVARVLSFFIPLRQRRDCAGNARSVSARGEAAQAAERPHRDVAGPRRHAHSRSGRCGRGRLSLVPFFADPKKGTRAAAAVRNGATLPSPTHEPSFMRDARRTAAQERTLTRRHAPPSHGRGKMRAFTHARDAAPVPRRTSSRATTNECPCPPP